MRTIEELRVILDNTPEGGHVNVSEEELQLILKAQVSRAERAENVAEELHAEIRAMRKAVGLDRVALGPPPVAGAMHSLVPDPVEALDDAVMSDEFLGVLAGTNPVEAAEYKADFDARERLEKVEATVQTYKETIVGLLSVKAKLVAEKGDLKHSLSTARDKCVVLRSERNEAQAEAKAAIIASPHGDYVREMTKALKAAEAEILLWKEHHALAVKNQRKAYAVVDNWKELYEIAKRDKVAAESRVEAREDELKRASYDWHYKERK